MWDIVDGFYSQFTQLITIIIAGIVISIIIVVIIIIVVGIIISIILVGISWFRIINLLISTIILSNPKILILLKLFGHKQLLIIKRRQIINLYIVMILINIAFEIRCALFFMMIFGRMDGFYRLWVVHIGVGVGVDLQLYLLALHTVLLDI